MTRISFGVHCRLSKVQTLKIVALRKYVERIFTIPIKKFLLVRHELK